MGPRVQSPQWVKMVEWVKMVQRIQGVQRVTVIQRVQRRPEVSIVERVQTVQTVLIEALIKQRVYIVPMGQVVQRLITVVPTLQIGKQV